MSTNPSHPGSPKSRESSATLDYDPTSSFFSSSFPFSIDELQLKDKKHSATHEVRISITKAHLETHNGDRQIIHADVSLNTRTALTFETPKFEVDNRLSKQGILEVFREILDQEFAKNVNEAAKGEVGKHVKLTIDGKEVTWEQVWGQ